MPSRAATSSALVIAATCCCCVLDTSKAFVVQGHTTAMTTTSTSNNKNNNNYWGKKNNVLETSEAFVQVHSTTMTTPTTNSNSNNYWGKKTYSASRNKVPMDGGGSIGFGPGLVPPQIGGFGAGNVVHLPRVPSPKDHASQKRSRGSSCPPLELGIFDVFHELAEAIEEAEELAQFGGGTLNEDWVDYDEADQDGTGNTWLRKLGDLEEPQSKKKTIVTTTGEEEVVVVKGEEDVVVEEEGKGVLEKKKGLMSWVKNRGLVSWVKKRVLKTTETDGGDGGGGGGSAAVAEHEGSLPGLVSAEDGTNKRPAMPDTQATGWLGDDSDQFSLKVLLEPGIVHKVFRDPSYLRERSKASYRSPDSSSSSSSHTSTASTTTTSSSGGSCDEHSHAEERDAAAARAEAGAKDDQKGGGGGAGGGGGGSPERPDEGSRGGGEVPRRGCDEIFR